MTRETKATRQQRPSAAVLAERAAGAIFWDRVAARRAARWMRRHLPEGTVVNQHGVRRRVNVPPRHVAEMISAYGVEAIKVNQERRTVTNDR